MWTKAADQDEDPHLPPLPGHKPHRCTDVFCLLVFLAALGHAGMGVQYAIKNGNLKRLTHGSNYKGERCGSKGLGEYVFWCNNSKGKLDLKHAMCINECPASRNTTTDCVVDTKTGLTSQTKDYPTRVFLWYYCLPEDEKLVHQVIDSMLGDGVNDWIIREMSAVLKARLALLAAAGFAMLTGFIYLLMLGNCAQCLIRFTMVLLTLGPMAVGGYFVWVSRTGGSDGIEGTQDSSQDLIMGVAAIVGGLIMGIIGCCASSGLGTAVGCIEASCECIFQNPSILFEPFISLTHKVLILGPLGWVFLLLLSCSDGEWTTQEKVYIGEFLFLFVWLMELTHAMSQYSLSFATQLWYFTPYENDRKTDLPSFGVCQGYCNAFFFHLGSLAFASFLFAILRVVHTLLKALVSASQNGNNCMAKCCCCCVQCFESTLAFLNKNAYMDMAISSSNYCVASERALEILDDQVPAVAALNGAQVVFQFGGVGIISLGSAILTLVLTKCLPLFTDPDSKSYVSDPKPVAVAAGIIGFVFAVSFMLVFDTVGDTILYCFTVDQRRMDRLSPKVDKGGESVSLFGWLFSSVEEVEEEVDRSVTFAPPRLRELIASEVAQHADMEMS